MQNITQRVIDDDFNLLGEVVQYSLVQIGKSSVTCSMPQID